jgi:hypothetical protein
MLAHRPAPPADAVPQADAAPGPFQRALDAQGNPRLAERMRALAGAQGNTRARILCQAFHAELLSVAGQYRVFEEIPRELRGKPVQAWLEDDKLRVEILHT